MSQYRHLQVTTDGDVFVARFRERRLIGAVPGEVGEELKAVASQEDCYKLVLSFSGVDLLSSEMLGRLIVLHKKMQQKGGQLKLCQIHPNVYQVFVITKFNTIFDIEESEESCVMAMA